MTHITVDVNDEWQARDIVSAVDSVQVDFDGSEHGWGYGGGRHLSRLAEDAPNAQAA